jgi:2-(1,2-epoxy-1,2-dihydrophenyl)acetyl-CoA isomerase
MTMTYENLLFERRGRLARVTLNRPDKLNALNLAMIDELRAAAAAIDADSAIRAVLLCAAGRAFSSGADLTRDDFFEDAALTPGQTIGRSLTEHFNPMVSAWYDLRVPVVVAVNGIAAGAGMSLALVGDIVLAAHSATFLQLFAPKLGLMPDLGSTFHLPRLVGTARAKGMALLGDAVPAAQAERWGLIWACLDDERLMEQADAMAQRFAAGPTQAFTRIKAVFNEHPSRTMAEQLTREALAQAELGDTDDFAEGLQAWRSKRPPQFNGR